MNPILIIDNLRKTDNFIKDIFMRGGCYQFYLFLKALFPVAMPYINNKKDHVITRIGGRFYDITGEVDNSDYYPLSKQDKKKCEKWSFGKKMLLQITECPFCEEPICV